MLCVLGVRGMVIVAWCVGFGVWGLRCVCVFWGVVL